MTNQLLLSQPDLDVTLETDEDEANGSLDDIASYHNCLVAGYLSYLEAAGYSRFRSNVYRMEQGARRFLYRFPDPNLWLDLSPGEQRRCHCTERSFVHYLFLRRILPMPLTYILMPKPRFYQMAARLIERETYQLYRKAASRLGYCDAEISSHFRVLLCLMIWTQKPLADLTLDDLETFTSKLRDTYADMDTWRRRKILQIHGLPVRWSASLTGIRNVLYHMEIFPQLTRSTRRTSFEKQWKDIPAGISVPVRRYLQQMALSLRTESAYQEKAHLFRFFSWLACSNPQITRIGQIQRCHVEAFKEYLRWAPLQHKSNGPGDALCPATRYHLLASLYYFFIRITEWQWPEAPRRVLVFTGDFPILDRPSPKFLDEIAAARFLQAARNHPDLFTRLCCVTLLLTGMRQGEFLSLTADCIVQIGENYWLRVPLGKMHNDRYIPLHPEVKQLLDEWTKQNPPKHSYDFLFTRHGYRLGRSAVVLAVKRVSKAAGLKEHVPPHRLRHTFATLAINRGMPLESIAALLGHRSLSMTMVYARIGNRTVQQEYSQVSQALEELCHRAEAMNTANLVEGSQMRRLRQDHWRMLGNGYCTRPDGVPCEYETICESCPCFSTTVEFLPILHKQKKDAEEKGQKQRVDVFLRLIQGMEQAPAEANMFPT
jgi:integrase